MTRRRSTVVVLNYHRVVPTPEPGPPHMLHTVLTETFRRQIDRCCTLGSITTLDAVVNHTGLGTLAFLVTFDDVPAVSVGAMETLAQDGVPYAVSVCAGLAEAGRGWRDKVYAITRHAPHERVLDAVGMALGEPPPNPDSFSFYHFTKSARLHPDRIMRDLVDPLFDELPATVRAPMHQRAYVGWPVVVRLSRHPLVTLANHSWSHATFDHLTSAERRSDIIRAHAAIESATGDAPRHFTVPFGHVTQELLVDLTAVAYELGYRTVLWTKARANLVVEPYLRRHVLHLLRIDVAPTIAGFEKQLQQALQAPLEGPAALLLRAQHRDQIVVTSGSDHRRSAVLETLLRPGKDYAASPEFYDYAFTSNPYRGTRSDYAVASSSAGHEAIAYAFHTRFAIGAARADGLYVASWRRLPRSGRLAGSAVFRRLVGGEAVVGVYKASGDSAPALRGWTVVDVFEHTIDVTTATSAAREGRSYDVVRLATYDPLLDALASAATAGRFTVAREAQFYRWRIDRYPLARATYVVVLDRGAPVAFAALLTLRNVAAVADFAAPAASWRRSLFEAAFAAAADAGARTVTVETSSHACSRELTEVFGGRCLPFQNHYRIARELSQTLPAEACTGGVWNERFVHETQVTGDVLLR